MNPESKAIRRAEVVDEVSRWGVGLGIITVALFPLSIPFLLLTAVALLPLLVPVLALGLIAGIVALPVLLVRRRVRRRRLPRERYGSDQEIAPLAR
jgi:membrane protein implicated in regulation of membrane protease activity